MSFDRLYDLAFENQATEDRPFWTVDDKDDEALLKWCNDTLDGLKKASRHRIDRMRKNLASYRGIQYKSQNTKTQEFEGKDDFKRSKNPRIVVNHMLDLVEQHVSKTTKFRPAVASIPASDDLMDVNIAKIADDLIEGFWANVNIDKLMQMHTRIKRICGESYLLILWDPDKGYYDPQWVAEVFEKNGVKEDPAKLTLGQINSMMMKYVKSIPRIPLIGDNGNQISDDKGKPLYIDKPVRVGDVIYKLVMPWRVFMQRQESHEESEFFFWTEYKHVDEIRAEHPEKASKLNFTKAAQIFDASTLQEEKFNNKVEVAHFYHRTNGKLDKGKYVKFIRDVILDSGDNGYCDDNGRRLPMDRLTDLDYPGTVDGDSLVTHARPIQNIYNLTVSMGARTQFLFAHPKWMVPQGSVKHESLGNSTSLVQYKGPQPPIMSQPAIMGADAFQWKEDAKQDLLQIMAVSGVSRGEPPPGVKAGVALQFLDEQENERESSAISKHNASITNIARQTLALMGQKYSEDERRLEHLLGRSKAAQIESFRFGDLASIVDVRLPTSSALPRQKAARVQTLLDLSERFPEQLDGRQVLEMLELGQADKFINIATVAVRAAETENDTLIRTGEIAEAEKWEDHIMHYSVHMAYLNDPSSKKEAATGVRQKLENHIAAHEMLMWEIAQNNPPYMERLMLQFPNYPVFFVKPPPMLPLPGALPPQMGPLEPVGAGAGPMAAPPSMQVQPEVPFPPGAENLLPVGAENFIPGPPANEIQPGVGS